MTTHISKGLYGWKAETVCPLDFTIEGHPAELRLTTGKGSRSGVSTTAAVQTRDGGFTTMRLFRDYHATVLSDTCRATEKAVTSQHAVALQAIDRIKDQAILHHTVKGDVA